jgi:hypothetical protein
MERNENETWFLTGSYRREIEPVSVERSTESSVWVKGRRCARITGWGAYYPTWQEAKDALVAAAEKRVASATAALTYANEQLAKMKSLEPVALATSANLKEQQQ